MGKDHRRAISNPTETALTFVPTFIINLERGNTHGFLFPPGSYFSRGFYNVVTVSRMQSNSARCRMDSREHFQGREWTGLKAGVGHGREHGGARKCCAARAAKAGSVVFQKNDERLSGRAWQTEAGCSSEKCSDRKDGAKRSVHERSVHDKMNPPLCAPPRPTQWHLYGWIERIPRR